MSIEIDVLNGDASWTRTEPLHTAVFGQGTVDKLPWGHIKWANADLRVLIDAPEGGLACHVGIYFRTIDWNGNRVHVGGIGGMMTREDCRGRGYASLALSAAIDTIRANEAVRFALLVCGAQSWVLSRARLGAVRRGNLVRATFGTRSLRCDGALRVRHQARAAAGPD